MISVNVGHLEILAAVVLAQDLPVRIIIIPPCLIGIQRVFCLDSFAEGVVGKFGYRPLPVIRIRRLREVWG